MAEKRRRAEKKLDQMRKKGQAIAPVKTEGRTIARTFWGKAWCDNLEAYSDFENRLPRGRTYLRNGSVLHLEVTAGRVEALVSGSELYRVEIDIAALAPAHWKKIKKACSGGIASLVDLLQGKLSAGVMTSITRPREGLFPAPKEIALQCSCPDWAGMCKHVAAALYGVGTRLDEQPELLFLLRQVDHTEMIAEVDAGRIVRGKAGAAETRLSDRQAAEIFGIELEEAPAGSRRKAKPAKQEASRKDDARSSKAVGKPSARPTAKVRRRSP